MNGYEKLGMFYLGKRYDLRSGSVKDDLILYDSKDLTTHAVIIGMTGSGKTGLGIGLLEEALIDHIPVIAIDPKGDLPNLLLTFPELRPQDFRPWINEQEALTKGLTPDAFARKQAELWEGGLSTWGQAPERIARLKEAATCTVYTPGSSAGTPLSVLRSFSPPPSEIKGDADLLREMIQTTATSLLALLRIDADPITSREHILIANILESSWAQDMALDLAGLIRAIQSPPFSRVGIMDLDSFYSAKDRFSLAMQLNNLLAAPGFESWLEGEPLNINRLLYTDQGRPRASIFTISHLSDPERMFFVSTLLNAVLGWMRTQGGTTSLRAILYMDEIFGYFPPVQNPPSKTPLLTLLKQARAFGLGVVLATQNPVDLDYKGLANTGTWCIGRLQTERDKERVLAGLEGAAAGTDFNRGRMEEILAGLGPRTFLLHNVHETAPVIFQTRWTLSYLRGPMTREQIKIMTSSAKESAVPVMPPGYSAAEVPMGSVSATEPARPTSPPITEPGIDTFYLDPSGAGHGVVYVPGLLARAELYYSSTAYRLGTSRIITFLVDLQQGSGIPEWHQAQESDVDPVYPHGSPVIGAEFAELPSEATRASSYQRWNKEFLRWVGRNRPLILYHSKRFKLTSQLNESEGQFRARLAQAAREKRDFEVEKIRTRYAKRFAILRDRLLRADQAISREQEQAKSRTVETAISFGSALLGAILGRKVVSATSATRVGTAMKSASRLGKEKMDVARALERKEAVSRELQELEVRLQDDISQIEAAHDPAFEELDEIMITPRSTDVTLRLFGLVWMPYRKDATGRLSPDWRRQDRTV